MLNTSKIFFKKKIKTFYGIFENVSFVAMESLGVVILTFSKIKFELYSIES
jgi:hypothetical protein